MFCRAFVSFTCCSLVILSAARASAFTPARPWNSEKNKGCRETVKLAVAPTKGESLSPDDLASTTSSRRRWIRESLTASAAITAATLVWGGAPNVAEASGGATAGRYTTIPIAKRRYYGRVQEGVHEFLEMGPDVVKGDMTVARIQTFFDPQGAVIVAAKRKDVNGQCTKKDGDCKGREIRDSRYNDMKASMYLLGNAFRTDQQKPPDRLPTVRAAKAFFATMDEMQKRVQVKKPKTNDPESVQLYARALDILEKYLDLVELPPIDSGHYDQEFDTLVGETARIT